MAMKLSAPPTADILLAAYDRHADEIRAFPAERRLSRVNFDFPTATAIALGAQPALLGFREAIREQLPRFPLRYVDELDSVTHAALYVYMQSVTAPPAESALAALADRARAMRKKLQADAGSAIAHELMEASALDGVPTGNGRLEIAQGVLGLCVAFRASWARVQGHSPVTEEMLAAATQLGVNLLAALGKDENPTLAGEALPIEAQWLNAASLFHRVYDQCRRAMDYLRWDEGDAADFTPALTGPRGPRAKQPAEGAGAEPAPATPPNPSGAPPTK